MTDLRTLHLQFREGDILHRKQRRELADRRAAGDPEAQRPCTKAIDCDPRETGCCRWCGRKVTTAVPKPQPPYSMNQGDVLKNEAYNYFWGDDEVDLPYWYQGTGREVL